MGRYELCLRNNQCSVQHLSTKDLGEIQDSVYPEIAFALENLDIILEIRIDIRKLIDIRKFKNVI